MTEMNYKNKTRNGSITIESDIEFNWIIKNLWYYLIIDL